MRLLEIYKEKNKNKKCIKLTNQENNLNLTKMELTISEKLAIANSLEEAIRRLEFIMCGETLLSTIPSSTLCLKVLDF